MRVPLLDLHPQMEGLREEILAAMTAVVDSTQYVLGPRVEALEGAIAAYCGAGHAIGMSSGTDALLVALMAMGIGPGSIVVTTPYTFFATLGSILRLGAEPLFVDIDPVTYNIDPSLLAEALSRDAATTARVKAIIPVHLFGQCADMAPINVLAAHYGIPVIEDSAQAIGAAYPLPDEGGTRWVRAGALGTAGCFSFFPSKNLGCFGDGGMVTVASDAALAETIHVLRGHGAKTKYVHTLLGGNFRLDPLQAVVLSIKLRRLPQWHHERRQNAGHYDRLFAAGGLAAAGLVVPPQAVYAAKAKTSSEEIDFHIYNQYVIRARDRDNLKSYLARREIGTEIYYPLPMHQQECLPLSVRAAFSMPAAEKAARETLALPIYPGLTPTMQEYIVENIASFYRERGLLSNEII